ncbi:hypothetical protein PCE1_003547 [Barthelona sp. PCE]
MFHVILRKPLTNMCKAVERVLDSKYDYSSALYEEHVSINEYEAFVSNNHEIDRTIHISPEITLFFCYCGDYTYEELDNGLIMFFHGNSPSDYHLIKDTIMSQHITSLDFEMEIFDSLQDTFFCFVFNRNTSEFLLLKDRLGAKSTPFTLFTDACMISSCAHCFYEYLRDKLDINTLINTFDLPALFLYRFSLQNNEFALNTQSYSNNLTILDRTLDLSDADAVRGYIKSSLTNFFEPFLNLPLLENRVFPLGVLFSGGVDSTLLAAHLASLVPPNTQIDLYNVAFDHKNIKEYDTPDRITGLAAWEELKECFPAVEFNMCAIDVPVDEGLDCLKYTLFKNILPSRSSMDVNIALALCCASSSKAQSLLTGNNYTRPNYKGYLLAQGADELFGGYKRLHSIFAKHGYSACVETLKTDIDTLWYKNLPREDRLFSFLQKTAYFPLLNERFMRIAYTIMDDQELFSKYMLNPTLQRGIGEKIVLRQILCEYGLERTATNPKRAIQFGSKSAKIANAGKKGTVDMFEFFNSL